MGGEKEKNIFSRAAKANTSLHMQAFSQEYFVGPKLFSRCSDISATDISA